MYFNCFAILALTLSACKAIPKGYIQPTTNVPITSELSTSAEIDVVIAPYREGMSEAMNEVIGFCPAFLEKRRPKSILGDFMAEATYQAAAATGERVDYCLLNYGGIRSSLDSGDITIGEVYQIMPFENEITILTISKAQLDTLFSVLQDKGGEPFADHLWKGQTAYHIMNRTHYRIATNDYMANGGDNYTILTKAVERIDTGIKIRDGLIAYIKKNNPLPLTYEPSRN